MIIRYVEDKNKSKCLIFIPVDKDKSEIHKYREAWNKIKYVTDFENENSTEENIMTNT